MGFPALLLERQQPQLSGPLLNTLYLCSNTPVSLTFPFPSFGEETDSYEPRLPVSVPFLAPLVRARLDISDCLVDGV